ncbi:MAG: DUF1320 family protein, partial [Gammaproteobacteria bacterium]|nr:DUF1320 family protein [Gammaproteobacteria bacterium]
EIDDVVLNRAIDDGVAEASSYLLPVGLADITPPYSLKIRVCDIARYYLYEEGMITEVVKDRYERAIAWLKMVRKDPAMLTGNETAVKASQSVKVIPMVRR